jgi:hypothetical protein
MTNNNNNIDVVRITHTRLKDELWHDDLISFFNGI